MNTGQMIIDRLSSKGFSKLELENNTSVDNLIELFNARYLKKRKLKKRLYKTISL